MSHLPLWSIVLTLLAACVVPVLAADITVDPAQRYQRIDGFGACLVAWVEDLREMYRTEEFQRTYVQDVGANMLRVNMWGPVYEKPVENWQDIRWQDFDMSANGGRGQIFIDFGQGIRKLDPEAKIIGTVWSPPAWMKMNKSIVDERSGAIVGNSYTKGDRTINNRVDPKYYRHFAKWMVEYIKLHEAKGAPFYAVSLGNEVMFTQSFESCVWTAPDYVEMVKILGEMLEAEGYGHVKIFGPETMTGHNWSIATPMYVEALMNDPEAAEHFDIFATHGYSDGVTADMSQNSSAQFHELIAKYDRPYWMTEGGTGEHDWPAPVSAKGLGTAIHNALVAGHASAFVPWQMAGGRANHHNLMDRDKIDRKTNVAQQYFRLVRPGAVRVDASPAYGDVTASAYVHDENQTLTVVLTNPTDQAQDVTVRLAGETGVKTFDAWRTSESEGFAQVDAVAVRGQAAMIALPAQSIVTLHGSMGR